MNQIMQSWGLSVLAQANVSDAVQVRNVLDFVVKGGILMYPISLCSLAALTIIVERVISLRRSAVIPPAFLPGLKGLLKSAPGDKEAALALCRRSPSPVAAIFAAGIARMERSPEVVERAIEQAGEREVIGLRRNLRALSVIASVSPLLGLLGTIFGMIMAFQTVATSGEALGKTELLAEGIYVAMITTAAGLCVAIPALLAYHWLSARVARLVAEMDRMTVEFVEEFVEGRVPAVPAATQEHRPRAAPEPAVRIAARMGRVP